MAQVFHLEGNIMLYLITSEKGLMVSDATCLSPDAWQVTIK
jgi:hypothetical protein